MAAVFQSEFRATAVPGRARRSLACNHCRTKKIRCNRNGNTPCANCLDRGERCIMTARRRQRVQSSSQSYDAAAFSRRIGQVEALLQTQTPAESSTAVRRPGPGPGEHGVSRPDRDGTPIPPWPLSHTRDASIEPQHRGRLVRNLNLNLGAEPATAGKLSIGQQDQQDQQGQAQPNTTTRPLDFVYQQLDNQSITPSPDGDPSIGGYETQDTEQEDSSVYAVETPNLEYFGPRCFLSFCSRPGIDWVTSKTKSPGFHKVATRLVKGMTRMLKINGNVLAERTTELSPETAWQYTAAYFEEAPEAAFGVVERPWFESRLRAHFSGAKADDKYWYAFRNVLWASGCRILLSRTTTFSDACQTSWALFENALSAHTEILYLRSSMLGVQTLILMAYFSEGLGSPSLQYMLCSNALRLACSKGLHRQPASSWNMSTHEVEHRNWMFWSIYCLEKQTCRRSGRPSAMDDDEISCLVPQNSPNGRTGNARYCRMLIEVMRLTSLTTKRLSSVRGLRQSAEQLLETVRGLSHELDVLKSSTQHILCFDDSLDASSYMCLVIDIHSPLANPWSGPFANAKQSTAAFAQYESSCAAVAQACRAVILAARLIHVNAGCPSLLAIYSPVYAFLNLFIHILRDAKLSTSQSDLAFMDIALGYFSTVELATNFQMPLLFVKDICHYARLAVEQARINKDQTDDETNNETLAMTSSMDGIIRGRIDDFNGTAAVSGNEIDPFGMLPGEDMETWSTLLQYSENDDIFGDLGVDFL